MTTSENMEETLEPSSDWQRYVTIIQRHHLLFFVILLSVWAVVWSASWVLPARYKSSTLILVEQPTMPTSYVPPNITDNLQDRLQSITQQILSRTRLLTIINKWHLYSGPHSHSTPNEKVQRMRKDITIELVKDPREDTITAFTVAYSASSAATAQRVTNELTQLFIDDNSRLREQESEQTTSFLTGQLENARRDLATQADMVREFEDQHVGSLPSQEQSNLQILNGLQAQLQNEQDQLNNAKQQRVYLESLVQQYQAMHVMSSLPDAEQNSLQSIDQTLTKMRAQLAALRVRYTDSYPDIQDLKREIANTQASRRALLAAQSSTAPSTANEDAFSPEDEDTSLHSEQLQLRSQLRANSVEIANREHSIASLLARISGYQSRLNSAPMIQQRLADLSQGYDQSKKNYDALLTKANDSQMATSMEHLQEGERFKVLDPPSFPLKPDFPNRLKLSALGAALGIGFGIATILLIDFLDDRLHRRQDIQALLPAPILADVPNIALENDSSRNKLRVATGWIVCASTTVIILAGTAYSYLHQ